MKFLSIFIREALVQMILVLFVEGLDSVHLVL